MKKTLFLLMALGTAPLLRADDFSSSPAADGRSVAAESVPAAAEPSIAKTGPLPISFPFVGKVAARDARDIVSSTWSIGGEVLDRDFAVYDEYKNYLGPLGAKAIRLQAGWAKTEKEKGAYRWEWLDKIVDDARERGLHPWIQLSYGNPIYPKGGSPNIFGALPSSDEALGAWDAWVRAAVQRYKDRVDAWEIWNEPDLSAKSPVEGYAPFFVRTAQIVRQEAPQARIYALSLGHVAEYADRFLDLVDGLQKLDLIDAITFHEYPQNPDNLDLWKKLKLIVAKHPRAIELREGENGAPSTETTGALSGYTWTELTQAKWDLRRMLAFHGNGVAFNLFTIADFRYPKGMNRKGLLEGGEDHAIAGPKMAYGAAQNVFAIFDDTVKPRDGVEVKTSAAMPLAIYAYAKNGLPLITIWEKGAPVSDANTPHETDLDISPARFDDPVYVDLLSGRIFQVPRENWSQEQETAHFRRIPLYDAPIVLADRGAFPASPERVKP